MAQPKVGYLFNVAQLIIIHLFFSTVSPAFGENLLKEEAIEYRQKGYSAQQSGMLADALIFYEKAIQIDPGSSPVYNDLGVVNEMLGQPDIAEEAYLKAIALDPGYGKAYFNLAQLYEGKEDLSRAGEYWLKLTQLDEQEPSMLKKAENRIYEIGKLIPEVRQKYSELRHEYLETQASLLSQEVLALKKTSAQKEAVALKKSPARDGQATGQSYIEKAEAFLIEKDYINALRMYFKAQQLDPQNDQLDSLIEATQRKLLLQ